MTTDGPNAPRVVHLDDIEPVPGPGSLTWLPVRATLDIRAFGTNAYVASNAGDDVVEPHTESSGHQELYFVARGSARFDLDGEIHEARTGTYVFIPDGATHRHAVALEAGTTILSFGGPPTFEPSPWEWTFRAMATRHADPDAARAIMAEGLEAARNPAPLHYNLACLETQLENPDAAIANLERAIELQPGLAEHAAADDDLSLLHTDPRFHALLTPAVR